MAHPSSSKTTGVLTMKDIKDPYVVTLYLRDLLETCCAIINDSDECLEIEGMGKCVSTIGGIVYILEEVLPDVLVDDQLDNNLVLKARERGTDKIPREIIAQIGRDTPDALIQRIADRDEEYFASHFDTLISGLKEYGIDTDLLKPLHRVLVSKHMISPEDRDSIWEFVEAICRRSREWCERSGVRSG